MHSLTEPFLNIVGCCNFTEAKVNFMYCWEDYTSLLLICG